MAYLGASDETYKGLGEFGCGSGCGCRSCRSGAPELSQTYEQDEDLGFFHGPGRFAGGSPNATWNSAAAGYPGRLGRSLESMPFYGYAPRMTFGQPPPAPLTCPTTGIPPLITPVPFVSTPKFMTCPPGVHGTADPGAVIAAAVARAIEMLDSTIGQLNEARARICAGEGPGWPVIGDVMGVWLKTRLGVCVEDPRVWAAGSFEPIRSAAEVIRRLSRIRNLIASNVTRYVCGPGSCGSCDPGDWAFVCTFKSCIPVNPTIIHLCPLFFRPDGDPASEEFKKKAALYPEFQAQTVIHESSHLYYCTRDTDLKHPSFVSIGGAECVSQFVAATNDGPIDPDFETDCGVTTVCGPIASAGGGPANVAGFGAVGPAQPMIIKRTRFHPERAIRLTGRKAVRR